jgi:hypothetical protein
MARLVGSARAAKVVLRESSIIVVNHSVI